MAIFERRDDYNYIRWALEVKRKDHFTCAVCGRRGVELNSHHLNSWNDHPDERYDVDNGVTLCAEICHNNFHKIYGKGNNTKAQFEEFLDVTRTLMKISVQKVMANHAGNFLEEYSEKQVVIEDMSSFLDGYCNTYAYNDI